MGKVSSIEERLVVGVAASKHNPTPGLGSERKFMIGLEIAVFNFNIKFVRSLGIAL